MAFLQLLDYVIRALGLLFLIGVMAIAFRFLCLAGVLAIIFILAITVVFAACRISGQIGEME
jgi:hypothetical protein